MMSLCEGMILYNIPFQSIINSILALLYLFNFYIKLFREALKKKVQVANPNEFWLVSRSTISGKYKEE